MCHFKLLPRRPRPRQEPTALCRVGLKEGPLCTRRDFGETKGPYEDLREEGRDEDAGGCSPPGRGAGRPRARLLPRGGRRGGRSLAWRLKCGGGRRQRPDTLPVRSAVRTHRRTLSCAFGGEMPPRPRPSKHARPQFPQGRGGVETFSPPPFSEATPVPPGGPGPRGRRPSVRPGWGAGPSPDGSPTALAAARGTYRGPARGWGGSWGAALGTSSGTPRHSYRSQPRAPTTEQLLGGRRCGGGV